MTTKKPIKARDLTPMQRATLALVVMHCDLTLCHPRTGSVMLKRLVKLGLLNVCDSSYPGSKQTTWSATAAGKALADGHWYDWLHAVGWSWIMEKA